MTMEKTMTFHGDRVQRVVWVSDMGVSSNSADVLITYSLGSCIGLTLFDPEAGVGGLLHSMLALSRMDKAKAEANPCMFTDTGATRLIQTLLDMGASKARLVAKVAGAAAPLEAHNAFQIGERNYTVLRKVLWKNGILIAGEDVGGKAPRTMSLYMDCGVTTIKMGGVEVEL
ncbi:MAG: chemotaxis protein CheD [Candidatus Hydrogenedentota bacterium]